MCPLRPQSPRSVLNGRSTSDDSGHSSEGLIKMIRWIVTTWRWPLVRSAKRPSKLICPVEIQLPIGFIQHHAILRASLFL